MILIKAHAMKPVCLALLFLFCYSLVSAQKKDRSVLLKSEKLSIESNITEAAVDKLNQKAAWMNYTFFALLQFETMPSEETKKLLSLSGITLLEYIPKNTYTVSVRGKLNHGILKKAGARAIVEPTPQHKMSASLAEELQKKSSKSYKEVWVRFPKTFSTTEVVSQLKALDYEVTSTELASYRILSLNVLLMRLNELAALPFIEYVQPGPPKEEPLNFNSRLLSRANVLSAPVGNNGRGLNGEGVVVGVGDNASVLSHVDLSERVIANLPGIDDMHGVHVAGSVAGAGNLNELYRGYAPKASVINKSFSSIIYNAPAYVDQFGMVVTNNSYGGTYGCSTTGSYNFSSQLLDQQAIDYPNLQHVFAAGNSGDLNCSPYPAGFKSIMEGYQAAKNAISVGMLDGNENLNPRSSKGPVRDGRIKPEITALGTFVISTSLNNRYTSSSGTSMAAPAVTGGIAILYQRYRQLYGNVNPRSGLIKALLCNGATDRGTSGPDFSYGFGSMNLLRSVDMLEQKRFWSEQVANSEQKQFSIDVPANTAQLKVMLYWHDPVASSLSARALVNDLDLKVITPGAETLFPQILDTSAAGITKPAIMGPDHINNIEQVSLTNPQPGTYTIYVAGTEIAENPAQEFFVVYDLIPNSVVLNYPFGGEGLAPGENVKISWDSYGDASSTFSLDYSVDNGATWTNIAPGLNATIRSYTWKVPENITDKALVRVTKVATGQSSVSGAFSIIGVPTLSLAPVQCEGYLNINWTSVPNATDYEVLILQGDEMKTVAYTTDANYVFSGLSNDSVYWVSVRARINGSGGRRAVAVSRKPDNGSCEGAILDLDLTLRAIVSPVSGRRFTSGQLTHDTQVKVKIKNLDNEAVEGFTVQYSIDGGNSWTSEQVAYSIGAGEEYVHTFSTTANLSALGTYQLKAVVKADHDGNAKNDTLSKEVKYLDNQPIHLATPFVDDLETALPETYISNIVGIKGADRYDLISSTPYGRLRTYSNAGLASSGTKAFTLDTDRNISISNVNSLIGTFNLSHYDVNNDELRLSFQTPGNWGYNNKVWVRQDEGSSWIEVQKLNLYPYNKFNQFTNIEFGDSLLKYGQNVSSAFQIKWDQEGMGTANYQGFTIDDISIYNVIDDIQMVSIDTPTFLHCGLNASAPLKVTLRNCTNNTVFNIPVKYSVNDGEWVTETIPSIGGNTTFQHTFTKGLPLTEVDTYKINVIVSVATDSYRFNDTADVMVQNYPLVSSFPYLENFEQDNGGWFAEGYNNSWRYGKPLDPQISDAASGSNTWNSSFNSTSNSDPNNYSESYLYSPCFNISGMKHPTLSFSFALNMKDCGADFCSAAWVDYSEDGINWNLLESDNAFNWHETGFDWSAEKRPWHVVTIPLPSSLNNIHIRFNFFSYATGSWESIAIDDVHIYDKAKDIYDGESLAAPITQSISGGNEWIHFESGGKLIASIHPNGQNLGTTNVNVYVNKDSVRNTNGLYYLDRSFTIQPSNPDLHDSVTVRLYFLDSEVEALINVPGCPICFKPRHAFDLGVSHYEDKPVYENGTVEDNKNGIWSFYPKSKVVMVPFDKGYYVDLKVKEFSEFWLSGDNLGNHYVLPVVLSNFNVRKEGRNDVLVLWTAESEVNVDRYEIEVAQSGEGGSPRGTFKMIGNVTARGDQSQQRQYVFRDAEFPKSGTRHYRLKIVDKDDTFAYSDVLSLTFPAIGGWMVYPNPSDDGKFYFIYQTQGAETLKVQLTDAIGRLIKTYQLQGNGYAEKLLVDISAGSYASGVYMLKVVGAGREEVFKVYKR